MIELIVQEISLDETGALKSILFEVRNDWIHHPYTATVRRGRNSGKVEITHRKNTKNKEEIVNRMKARFEFFNTWFNGRIHSETKDIIRMVNTPSDLEYELDRPRENLG